MRSAEIPADVADASSHPRSRPPTRPRPPHEQSRRRRHRRRTRRVDRVHAPRAAGRCKVELFERETFPRFHIGESLIPETYWVLKRLGMLEKMQQSHFVKKYSVQFVNASGKQSAPFYFWDNKPHECSQTWQVVRSEFDQMLLENAREHGVTAHEGVRVMDVIFEGRSGRRREAQGPRGPREGRRRRQRPERPHRQPPAPARLGSDPEQGRDLDLLEGAYRDTGTRRRRDDGAPDARQAGLVLVHPAARQHRQRRRRRAVRLPVQEPRQGLREDLQRRSRADARR